MLRRFCICLSLLVLSFPVLVSAGDKSSKPAEMPSELVSSALLGHCGLETAWSVNLFVKPDEKIERIFAHDKYLFAFTDQNFMYCLNRLNGEIVFHLILAEKGLPVRDPIFNGNNMYYFVGSKLHTVDLEVGQVTKTRAYTYISSSAVYGPVFNDDFIYLSGSNNRLSAIDAEKMTVTFQATAKDDSEINSIVADNDNLVFASETGEIVRLETDEAKLIWRFEVGGITAPMVRDGEFIYVSSQDRKIYKLKLEDGFSAWLTSSFIGEPLNDPVRMGKKVLYQYGGKNGLFAIDKKDGKKLWQLKEGYDLLCENGSTVYTLAKPSKLVVMDNDKKKKLYSVNFADVSLHIANTQDSMIYVGCEKGRLMCIKTDTKK